MRSNPSNIETTNMIKENIANELNTISDNMILDIGYTKLQNKEI